MRTKRLALMAVVLWMLPGAVQAAPLREFLEAEELQGVDGVAWQKMSGGELTGAGAISGNAAVRFRKGGDTTKVLKGVLPRRLDVGEKAKFFWRVLPPGEGRSAWIEITSGGEKIAFEVKPGGAQAKRVWVWTQAQVLTPPVGGDAVEVGVSSAESDVALDVLYVTTDLAESQPPKYAEAEGPDLGQGLMFYADFDDTADPLQAAQAPLLQEQYAFVEGRVGKALHLAKGNFRKLPSYPTKGNFPYEQGTLAFWFRPDWRDPAETGEKYMHVLSVSVPGRFYVVVQPKGLSASVFFPTKGDFEVRTSGRGEYFVPGAASAQGWAKGTWVHFAWSWGKERSHLYVNGSLAGRGKGIPENHEPTLHFGGEIQVGGYGDNDRVMNGSLDELATWNRMLSADEVRELFTRGQAHKPLLPQAVIQELRAQQEQARRAPQITVRNVLENGSFEAGASNFFYALNPYFAPVHFSPGKFDIVEEAAWHGKRSLRVTLLPKQATPVPTRNYGAPGTCSLQTLAYRLNPDQTFTFSCWLKAQSDAGLKVSLTNVGVTANAWQSKATKRVSVPTGTVDWQRIAFSAQPEKSVDNLYVLLMVIEHPGAENAVVYLDGLQISPGEEALADQAFRHAHPVTGALSTPAFANLFKLGKEQPSLTVCLANQSETRQKDAFLLRVYDLWNVKSLEQAFPVDLAPHEWRRSALPLPIRDHGIFRAELVRESDAAVVDEMSFSVLPDLGRVEALGVHAFFDEYSLEVAARFGATRNRCWDNEGITAWHTVQPDGPQFRWEYSDAKVALALSKGFKLLGNLYHVSHYEQSWVTGVRSHWTYQKAANTNRGAAFLANPELVLGWKQYVQGGVSRYKGKITQWELLNEPYNEGFGDWTPEDYLKLFNLTVPLIKSANPEDRIVAPCTYMLPQWCPPLIEKGLLAATDVFAYHGYGMGPEALATMKTWATADGKERPIFDTENSGMSGGQFFCRSYLGAGLSGWMAPPMSAARISTMVLRGRAYGTDVIFHYWMRAYAPYTKYGTLLEFNGTLEANAVAYSISAWMINGMQPKAILRLGSYVDCSVFVKPGTGEAVAALWDRRPFESEPASQVALAAQGQPLTACNLMANPLKLETKGEFTVATVTALPMYLKSPNAEALLGMLRSAKAISRGENTYIVTGTVKATAEGRPGLLLKVYNNSLEARSGTLSLVAVPSGFSLPKSEYAYRLAANKELWIEVPLAAAPPVARRARFGWAVADQQGAKEKGEFQVSLLLTHRRDDLVLDGDLKEWGALPVALINTREQVVVGPEKWKGERDCSGTPRVAWDAENLYLALEVMDDNFCPPPRPFWYWDTVELFLDTDLYGDWGAASTDADDLQLALEAQTETGKGFSGPDMIQGVSSVEGKVRRMEMKIPLAQMKLKGTVGTALGLDVTINNADGVPPYGRASPAGGKKEGTRRSQMVWTGAADNWRDPVALRGGAVCERWWTRNRSEGVG